MGSDLRKGKAVSVGLRSLQHCVQGASAKGLTALFVDLACFGALRQVPVRSPVTLTVQARDLHTRTYWNCRCAKASTKSSTMIRSTLHFACCATVISNLLQKNCHCSYGIKTRCSIWYCSNMDAACAAWTQPCMPLAAVDPSSQA